MHVGKTWERAKQPQEDSFFHVAENPYFTDDLTYMEVYFAEQTVQI